MAKHNHTFDMNRAFEAVEKKFRIYNDAIRAVAEGRMRHLFVQGAQGIGKTFAASKILGVYEDKGDIRVRRSAGRSTPLALYNDLFDMRHKRDITLFDDCDSVFENKDGLNLLKAATDTVPVRELAWASSSKQVITPRFTYEGSVVILTNMDLSKDKFIPLTDRVHVLRLAVSPEEKIARIISILRTDTKFSQCHDDVTMWLIKNHQTLGPRLSVRTAIKALELAAFNKDHWQDMADAMILFKD